MSTPASSPWAPAAGCSDTASMPAISASIRARSCMSASAPCDSAAGVRGCRRPKPLSRAMSSLIFGLYFMVHEPSG
jgi:hypothetical protein